MQCVKFGQDSDYTTFSIYIRTGTNENSSKRNWQQMQVLGTVQFFKQTNMQLVIRNKNK